MAINTSELQNILMHFLFKTVVFNCSFSVLFYCLETLCIKMAALNSSPPIHATKTPMSARKMAETHH